MTDSDTLAQTRRERAQRLQGRLNRMKNHGVLVIYQCQSCHFTTVLFGSDYATQLGEHKWWPGIEMDCCEDGRLFPAGARRGSKNQHNALIHLIRQGNRGAARALWNERLEDVSLDDLDYRDVQPNPDEPERDLP